MRKKMPETEYRASRICRALGNPTAYQIIKLLIASGEKRPAEIADELGLTPTLVSYTLRGLRNIDLVRYVTNENKKIYWLKEDAVAKICKALEALVGQLRQQQR